MMGINIKLNILNINTKDKPVLKLRYAYFTYFETIFTNF